MEGLLHAHESGATVFDTSDIYGFGHSQRLLGRMLAQIPRGDVLVTCTVGAFKGTGISPYSPLNLHKQVEQSLENLDVEQLDVVTLHDGMDFGPNDQYLDDALETLQALREQETVKAIGMRYPSQPVDDENAPACCAGMPRSHGRFTYLFQRIGPSVLSVPYSPLSCEHSGSQDGEDIFDFARRHGVATMICEPLAQGLLTGKYTAGAVFAEGDVRSRITAPVLGIVHEGLRPLRERFGSTPRDLARVALHYCLRRHPDSIVLAGFSTVEQVVANYECLGAEGPVFSDEDFAYVSDVYQAIRDALRERGTLNSRRSLAAKPRPGARGCCASADSSR